MIHTVKGFSGAEIDVFLEFLCFIYDPADVSNLIFAFSAFSKSSLYIWKFSVHILLKPSSKDFEHYLVACELSTPVQQFQHSLALPFFGIGMKLTFSSPVATAEYSTFADIIEYSTLTALSFKI